MKKGFTNSEIAKMCRVLCFMFGLVALVLFFGELLLGNEYNLLLILKFGGASLFFITGFVVTQVLLRKGSVPMYVMQALLVPTGLLLIVLSIAAFLQMHYTKSVSLGIFFLFASGLYLVTWLRKSPFARFSL